MTHVFCGVETVEPDALRAMSKGQNLRTPILQSVDTINRYGIEVAAGIILGLDTDTPETPDAIGARMSMRGLALPGAPAEGGVLMEVPQPSPTLPPSKGLTNALDEATTK